MNRLELLNPSLIEQFPHTVREIDRMCHRLGIELGWHYILDIIWILQQLDCPLGSTILDAGAGNGAVQFVLAERGYNILSIDFSPRFIPLTVALMFRMENMGGKEFQHPYINHLQAQSGKMGNWPSTVRKLRHLKVQDAQLLLLPVMWAGRVLGIRKPGKVSYYRADMGQMDAIADKSVDAVVSVSAIEHMGRETITATVAEFERVLKPGGRIIVTTSAAKEKGWFHKPSKGWCFSEATLKQLFRLGSNAESNWNVFDSIMHQVRASRELQRRIPFWYYLSGDNGLPWGKWDPKYLPVGVLKIKQES